MRRPYSRNILSLASSILIHGILLLVINWSDTPKANKSPKNKNLDGVNTLKINLKKVKVVLPTSVTNVAKTTPVLKKVSKKDNDSNFTLEQLAINSSDAQKRVQEKITQSSQIGAFGDDTGLESRFQGETGNSILLFLHQYILANMDYPKLLKEKKIEGYVLVRIVFDKQGNYQHQLSRIRSNSNHLRVLTSRTLKRIFEKPLPFSLDFIQHHYFLVDLTFRFNAKTNEEPEFLAANNFISERHLGILVQNYSIPIIAFRVSDSGKPEFGISYESIFEWIQENFTAAGKARKLFQEGQLERYKDDPAWESN